MRIVSVLGARSELVKCASISRALAGRHEDIVVHTGERYDYGTSPEFFRELGLKEPSHDLGLSKGTTAELVGAMLKRLAPLIQEAAPDWVLVYGSSSGTLAGALAASKVGVRVGHVEAGVRSYRRNTPDELYPILVDHVSALHFCPTEHAVRALVDEGLSGVHHVGDVLLDNVMSSYERAHREVNEAELLDAVGLDTHADFAFATVHHLENTEDSARLLTLIEAMSSLPIPVLLPLHPRSQESLTARPELVSRIGPNVSIIDPLRPLVTLRVVARARLVLTDSGGLQREAFFLGSPCITLRDGTEWVDTLDLSANTVVGADKAAIVAAVEQLLAQPKKGKTTGPGGPFGDGDAGMRIVSILEQA